MRKTAWKLVLAILVVAGAVVAAGLTVAGGTEIQPTPADVCVGRMAQLSDGTSGPTAVNPFEVTAVVGTGPASYTVLLSDGRTVQGFGSSKFGISEVNNAMNCRSIGDPLGNTRVGL